jgi:hypothetical protein
MESGTWGELAAAHRDLIPGPTSPSGLANWYATVPYAFPAAVPFTSLSPVSDALIGRRRWDAPDVIEELDLLWYGDRDEALSHIERHRQKVIVEYRELFGKVKRAEKRVYGENSYFYCLERGVDPESVRATGVPERVPEQVAEEVAAEVARVAASGGRNDHC